MPRRYELYSELTSFLYHKFTSSQAHKRPSPSHFQHKQRPERKASVGSKKPTECQKANR